MVFVDASGWIGLADPDDAYAAPARSILQRLSREQATLLTSNWTLYEALTVLRVGAQEWQRKVTNLRALVWESRIALVEVVTRELEDRAVARFFDLRAYPRRRWSVVDFANFVVMDSHGVRRALTQDRTWGDLGYALERP